MSSGEWFQSGSSKTAMEKPDEGQRGDGGENPSRRTDFKTPSLDKQWWEGAWPLATLVCLQVQI